MSEIPFIKYIKVPEIRLSYVLDEIDPNTWSDAKVAPSRYANGENEKEIRDASSNYLNDALKELLDNVVDIHINKYANENNIILNGNKTYHIVKYTVGQFFKEHIDATIEYPRKISALLYLNDDYEGGTITFTKLNVSIKPEKNTLIIFPSTKEFSHSADPVILGTKYVIVGFWE